MPSFPFDYPGLPAGRAWWVQVYQESFEQDAKKPPAKRLKSPDCLPDIAQDPDARLVKGRLHKGRPSAGAFLYEPSSQSVIGYVTNGGFSLKSGCRTFVGLVKSSYDQEICLVKNERACTFLECQIQGLTPCD